jgi:hypothetical protein
VEDTSAIENVQYIYLYKAATIALSTENSHPMTDDTVNGTAACLDSKLLLISTTISKHVTNLKFLIVRKYRLNHLHVGS